MRGETGNCELAIFECVSTSANITYRLRDLFTSEEQIYLTEMVDKEETVLEKQARMRERARSLREKREMERVAEADAKLEQRWR